MRSDRGDGGCNATWTCRRSRKSVKRCALLVGSLDIGTFSFRWNRLSTSKGKTRKFNAFYSSPRRVGLAFCCGIGVARPEMAPVETPAACIFASQPPRPTVKPLPFLSINTFRTINQPVLTLFTRRRSNYVLENPGSASSIFPSGPASAASMAQMLAAGLPNILSTTSMI